MKNNILSIITATIACRCLRSSRVAAVSTGIPSTTTPLTQQQRRQEKIGSSSSISLRPTWSNTIGSNNEQRACRSNCVDDKLQSILRGGGNGDGYYPRDDGDYYEGDRYPPNRSPDDDRYSRREDDYKYNQRNDEPYRDDYPPRRSSPPSNNNKKSAPSLFSKSSSLLQNKRQLGTASLIGGIALTLLGISLFFNKTLLRLGNILLILGVPLTIGPKRTAGYFFQPKKMRATGCLCFGIFTVLVLGRPMLGIAMEVFGLLNLFGNMFPVLLVMARQMPVVGKWIPEGGGKKKTRRRDEEEYGGRRNEQEAERYY